MENYGLRESYVASDEAHLISSLQIRKVEVDLFIEIQVNLKISLPDLSFNYGAIILFCSIKYKKRY